MRLLYVLLLAFMLTACTTTKEIPAITVEPVTIDSRILDLCPKLPEGLIINSFEELQVLYGNFTVTYVDCANKQAASVKLLKQFGNIK